MSDQRKDLAFPCVFGFKDEATGLTKRELFAAMAMQGYNSILNPAGIEAPYKYKWAVEDADALIKELDKPQIDKSIMAEMKTPFGPEADCIIHSTDVNGLCFKCGKQIREDLDNLTIQ